MKKHFKEIREFIASRNSSKQMKLYDIQKINLKRQFKPIRSGNDHHRNFQSNNRSKSPENLQNSDQNTKRPSLKRKLVIKIKSITHPNPLFPITHSSSSEKSNSTMRSTSSMTLKTIENRHNAQTSPLAYAEEARDPSLATHILDVRTEHELLSKSLSRHTQEKYGFADRVAVKQVNQILEICDDQGQKFNEHPYFCKKRLKQSESQGDPYQSRSPYLRSKEISLHCLKNWISPIKRFVPLKTKSSYSRKLRLQSNPRQLHQNQTVVQDHAQRIERNSMIKEDGSLGLGVGQKGILRVWGFWVKKFISHSKKQKIEKPCDIKIKKIKPKTIIITEPKEEEKHKNNQPKLMIKPVLSSLFKDQLPMEIRLPATQQKRGSRNFVFSGQKTALAKSNLESIAMNKFGSYTPI